jgi:hypothetical protein
VFISHILRFRDSVYRCPMTNMASGIAVVNDVSGTCTCNMLEKATSIPDTPRAMVRYDIYFIPLLFLRQIIKEKVNQDCVDLHVWLEFYDFAAE